MDVYLSQHWRNQYQEGIGSEHSSLPDAAVHSAAGLCPSLPEPDRRGVPAAGERTVRTLTNDQVAEMRGFMSMRVPPATRTWHEGSTLIGYWPEGDSYIFLVDGHKLCISRGYIEEAFRDTVTD